MEKEGTNVNPDNDLRYLLENYLKNKTERNLYNLEKALQADFGKTVIEEERLTKERIDLANDLVDRGIVSREWASKHILNL